MIKFWLAECCQNHTLCQSHYIKVKSPRIFPTRLVNVSDPDRPFLVLNNRSRSDAREYVTISHRWPDNGSIVKLTRMNIQKFKESIPLSQLPSSFKDAMTTARAAGFNHIWVDLLCIIQDSMKDWTMEANRMAYVYGNAALNLVLAGSSSDAAIHEPRNPLINLPCRLISRECNLFVGQSSSPSLKDATVFTRGWIVQERLLSRRNVYLGLGQLRWECFDGNSKETDPLNIPTHWDSIDRFSVVGDFEHKAHVQRLVNALDHIPNDIVGRTQEARLYFARAWARIVKIYSNTRLTYSNDKLAAIAGFASLITQRAALKYIAGMWTFTLPAALLWIYAPDAHGPLLTDELAKRPPWRGAPSWSWASIDGAICGYWPEHLDSETLSSLPKDGKFSASVLGCQVKKNRGRALSFGQVAEAKLQMKSVLRPIHPTLEYDMGNGGWTDGTREFSYEQIDQVFFAPDAALPKILPPLVFFTIFRGLARHWFEGDLQFREEGLVLIPHRDGFTRVGYMRVYFKESKDDAMTDLLWGDGQMETIFIY